MVVDRHAGTSKALQTRAASGVISRGWLKCVWIQTFSAEASRSISPRRRAFAAASPARACRCGPRRRAGCRAGCRGRIAAWPCGSVSGSPPETMTSRISEWSRTYSIMRSSLRLIGIPAAAHHRGPFPRAETAVHGADVRRDDQQPVRDSDASGRERASPCLLRADPPARIRTDSRSPAARAPTGDGSDRRDHPGR